MSKPFIFVSAKGNQFNSWTVLDDSAAMWKIECKCGFIREMRRDHVISNKTKSCMRCAQTKHGMEGTAIYNVWASMKQRCQNPNAHNYEAYGGRGITVCDKWQKFERFYADMGNKPKNYSLGRINNDLGYSLQNCRWETPKQQNRNRRNTRWVEIDGIAKPLAQWCDEFNIAIKRVVGRLKIGWNIEHALSTPIAKALKKGAIT